MARPHRQRAGFGARILPPELGVDYYWKVDLRAAFELAQRSTSGIDCGQSNDDLAELASLLQRDPGDAASQTSREENGGALTFGFCRRKGRRLARGLSVDRFDILLGRRCVSPFAPCHRFHKGFRPQWTTTE